MLKSSSSKLWILMITAFIDMVGLLMVLPLLPFYAKSLGQGGLVVGLLVSSFAVAQLLTAPMWGRLSDAYGRRPALLVGLSASAIAYVIFGYALELPHPLLFLFLCRNHIFQRPRCSVGHINDDKNLVARVIFFKRQPDVFRHA